MESTQILTKFISKGTMDSKRLDSLKCNVGFIANDCTLKLPSEIVVLLLRTCVKFMYNFWFVSILLCKFITRLLIKLMTCYGLKPSLYLSTQCLFLNVYFPYFFCQTYMHCNLMFLHTNYYVYSNVYSY